MKNHLLALLVATLLSLGACTDDDNASGASVNPSLEAVVVVVSYAAEAEPYTQDTPTGGTTWDLFGNNMNALLEGTGVSLTYPSALEQMQLIDTGSDEDFTVQELLALDDEYRQTEGDSSTLVFHAIWLDGYLFDDGQRQTGVIGVSIGDTGVIAIFKPVVERLGLTEVGRRFGEQTTLIHEVGHALGLVNNGIPIQSEHHDADNGAHCTNDSCVMYWANEGPVELVEFIVRNQVSDDALLFDDGCVEDVRAALSRE